MRRFTDQVAVVTGGASGIGQATGELLAAEGAHVILCDVQEDLGRQAADAIRAQGHSAEFCQCDISSEAAVEAFHQAVLASGKCPSILVNGAFRSFITEFLDLTAEQLQTELDINLKGPFYLSQRVARELMKRQAKGAIVNITSVAAEMSAGNQVAYSASKSGLAGLTRAMAIALAPHNIRVNAVAPGPTLSPIAMKVLDNPALKAAMLSRVPLGRYAECREQASAIAFLASDEASFITGHTLVADGGRMVLNHTMDVQKAAMLRDPSQN